MRIPTFIGITSLLIGSWLGVAFFREVPSRSYPLIEESLVGKPAAGVKESLITSRIGQSNEP